MTERTLTAGIERALEAAGIQAIVEEREDTITLSGRVTSAKEQETATEIAARFAQGKRIDNALEVEGRVPEAAWELSAGASDRSNPPDTVEEMLDRGGEMDGDFTDQELLRNPEAAAGPSSSAADPAADGDEVYMPPTDPVVRGGEGGNLEVLNGIAPTSRADRTTARSSDGRLGDEAIADAVRRRLSEDASTTHLTIDVEVRQGVARLRGEVADLDDVENAEAVAADVEGVDEVTEELTVRSV